MKDRIGVVAGQIWHLLNEQGELTPIKIKAQLGLSNTMLYLALGWLSREDKLNIEPFEYTYKISLC
ncbi:MAG: winged helix-turn-helix domain-containing protein [Elusimicrobia bacterium]|nr:winged helix-turn-helix domain-containing protein [Elusimicrobiota bacterium]